MQKIKTIIGHEPMREGVDISVFSVGHDGVTEIERCGQSFDAAGICWYRVWKGASPYVDMNACAVAEVHYEQEQRDGVPSGNR